MQHFKIFMKSFNNMGNSCNIMLSWKFQHIKLPIKYYYNYIYRHVKAKEKMEKSHQKVKGEWWGCYFFIRHYVYNINSYKKNKYSLRSYQQNNGVLSKIVPLCFALLRSHLDYFSSLHFKSNFDYNKSAKFMESRIVNAMDWIVFPSPPNSYVEAQSSNVTISGDMVFRW